MYVKCIFGLVSGREYPFWRHRGFMGSLCEPSKLWWPQKGLPMVWSLIRLAGIWSLTIWNWIDGIYDVRSQKRISSGAAISTIVFHLFVKVWWEAKSNSCWLSNHKPFSISVLNRLVCGKVLQAEWIQKLKNMRTKSLPGSGLMQITAPWFGFCLLWKAGFDDGGLDICGQATKGVWGMSWH